MHRFDGPLQPRFQIFVGLKSGTQHRIDFGVSHVVILRSA